MNDKKIDQALDNLLEQPIPEADSNRRKEAIAMAKENFSQGFETSPRLIGNRDNLFSKLTNSMRSFYMNTVNNRSIYNAFGTAAIAFVAVSVVFLMPSTQPSVRGVIDDASNLGTEVVTSEPQTQALESKIAVADSPSTSTPEPSVEQPHPPSEKAKTVVEPSVSQPNTTLASKSDNGKVTSSRKIQERKQQQPRLRTLAKPAAPASGASAPDYSVAQQPTLSFQEQEGGVAALLSKSEYDSDGKTVLHGRLLDEPVILSDQLRLDSAEQYAAYQPNAIELVSDKPVSTFSIDVDTASYSLIRNQLNNGYLPKPQAVRAEELINYFNYNYPLPSSTKKPFEPTVSVLESPWNEGKKLVHIGIKGYEISADQQPDSNLVFLLDVSGSMGAANKLPLVKQSINLLLDTLKPTDTVSIVVYAGAAGTVLAPTKVRKKRKILTALQNLDAGGSTAGSAGIQLAYELAEQNFDKDAVNRIILATDGDFNVGQRSNEDLKTLVERKRNKGVFLSVLGFGRNNYQDDMMQTLAQNGNGVAAYIDTLSEAKKVLVDEATSTLFPIAKDVKIQIEFNPRAVSEYRLVGYETRHLNREDFNNDKVDAGDIGAGHTVTAIYEITPANSEQQSIDAPRYSGNKPNAVVEKASRGVNSELGFLKMRYKLPNGTKSKLIEQPIRTNTTKISSDTQFSIAVAGFAQLLAGSKLVGDLNYDDVINAAAAHKGDDPFGYRSEFIQLARMAKIAKP